MHRTTIMLPMGLKQRARGLAHRMGVSLSELIRESLEATLRGEAGEVRENDPLYGDRAVHEGPVPVDLAEAHDDYLYGPERGKPSP